MTELYRFTWIIDIYIDRFIYRYTWVFRHFHKQANNNKTSQRRI